MLGSLIFQQYKLLIIKLFAAPVRREDVAEWANQEEEWTAGVHNTVEQSSWKHGYVTYLKMFYEIHSKWEQGSEPEKMQQLYGQLNRYWIEGSA